MPAWYVTTAVRNEQVSNTYTYPMGRIGFGGLTGKDRITKSAQLRIGRGGNYRNPY